MRRTHYIQSGTGDSDVAVQSAADQVTAVTAALAAATPTVIPNV